MSDNIENLFYQELECIREQVKSCALTIMEHDLDENLMTDYLKQLEEVLENCVKTEHSVALARNAAREAERCAVDETTSDPCSDLFDEVYDENLEELKQDFHVSEAIKTAPSIKEFKKFLGEQKEARNLNGQAENDENNSEEVVTTQQTFSLLDPISKIIMTDPVRHKFCGHVYDRPSVVSMIKTSGKKGFRCPTMGCGYRKPLNISDLEDAPDIKREIRRQQQRGGMSSSHSHH